MFVYNLILMTRTNGFTVGTSQNVLNVTIGGETLANKSSTHLCRRVNNFYVLISNLEHLCFDAHSELARPVLPSLRSRMSTVSIGYNLQPEEVLGSSMSLVLATTLYESNM